MLSSTLTDINIYLIMCVLAYIHTLFRMPDRTHFYVIEIVTKKRKEKHDSVFCRFTMRVRDNNNNKKCL